MLLFIFYKIHYNEIFNIIYQIFFTIATSLIKLDNEISNLQLS